MAETRGDKCRRQKMDVRGNLIGLVILLSILATSCGNKQMITGLLAHSDFAWDTDGWETEGRGVRDFEYMSKMIKAGDNGADTWYFVAPNKFAGSKRDAYGGYLSFRHGFFEYNSDGKSTMQDFDVIISSEVHGLTIGRRGIFPAWSFSSDHKLELHESAGWVLVDTNDPPSRPEMMRLLSKISCIKIRGGMYLGSEDAYIMDVQLVAGKLREESKRPTSLKVQSIRNDL